ncbi:MAG: MazG nucleotide pyrophosphohydrolase domain-containing protein [Planctomycetota bacterium]|jgi:NTP pyrophosphatase (non-canonical NTP hydrolase)
MQISEFQKTIEDLYFEKDAGRGLERTFMWFVEEVGELSRDLLHRPQDAPPCAPDSDMAREFADVLAWLSTLASIVGLDLQAAAQAKYGRGCPKCTETPCACHERAGSAAPAAPGEQSA